MTPNYFPDYKMNLKNLLVLATVLAVVKIVDLSDVGMALHMMLMFTAFAAYFLRYNIRY